jgi:hypothetical protein
LPSSSDHSLDFENTDFREHPDLYRVGRGEHGFLSEEPYKSEILPPLALRDRGGRSRVGGEDPNEKASSARSYLIGAPIAW